MEIRAARESELEQIVELNCIAFNPNQHERYWQYVRGDSSYRLSQSRVVVVNDKVVSTLRVWERRIRIGASIVTMGGIGGVCTREKYRGVGYASALMRDTIIYGQTNGYDIGVLFTIIPEEFYHRFGWRSLPLHGFEMKFDTKTDFEIDSHWKTRPFNLETDLDTVSDIYDLANSRQSGTISRTRSYWDMVPSRIRGILPTVVAHHNGNVDGYLNYEINDQYVDVHEVGYNPNSPDILDSLISNLLVTCKTKNVNQIKGAFISKHPFVEQLCKKCNGEIKPTTDTAMMLYAISLPVLLRRFVVEWETQIALSDKSLPSLAVKTPIINGQQVVIRFNGRDTIQIVDNAQEADILEINDEDFWQLLFGEKGWEQVSEYVSISEKTSEFLSILFPKRDVIYWSPDRY